jgi:hypothetical protein
VRDTERRTNLPPSLHDNDDNECRSVCGTVLELAAQEDAQPSKSPFTEPALERVLTPTLLSQFRDHKI